MEGIYFSFVVLACSLCSGSFLGTQQHPDATETLSIEHPPAFPCFILQFADCFLEHHFWVQSNVKKKWLFPQISLHVSVPCSVCRLLVVLQRAWDLRSAV